MDIDAKYPTLSKLAVANKLSLSKIAISSYDHDGYFTLADCCEFAQYKDSRYIYPFHYLATLNLFLELLPNYAINSIESSLQWTWNRIYKKSNSSFLDVLAEAAYVIHLHSIGADFKIDVPFNTSNGNKDADIKLCSNGKDIWLDVVSVQLKPSFLNERYPRFISINKERAQEWILSELCKRTKKKYNEKFKEALESGSLKNASVGILICIIKSTKEVMRPFLCEPFNDIQLQSSIELFSKTRPGLTIVKVFNLGLKDGQEHLEPTSVFEWINKIY